VSERRGGRVEIGENGTELWNYTDAGVRCRCLKVLLIFSALLFLLYSLSFSESPFDL
jgi:hypothetical protein